jgi:hypothetical protein
MKSAELERRLNEWADEYAGGKYDNVGAIHSSPVAVLMKYHGRAPQGLNPRPIIGTPADEVELAVCSMRQQRGGDAMVAVVRAEYWMRSAALEHRLQRIRKKDRLKISARAYYVHLHAAKNYIAGWLHLPLATPATIRELIRLSDE